MSLFSPVTSRSFPVRILYLSVYLLLTVGACSMVVPLLVTLSGSMSSSYESEPVSFFPKFLVNDRALWERYLEARYGGVTDHLRMAWNRDDLDFYAPPYPPLGEEEINQLALWKAFRKEEGPLSTRLAGAAFTRLIKRDASFENRRFRQWLLARYDNDLAKVNQAVLTDAPRTTSLLPPPQNQIVLSATDTPLNRAFSEYLQTLPEERRLIWDVGGYFRAVYLPRQYGTGIGEYNAMAGTSYRSFSEIPFPAALPPQGAGPWLQFVREILNPAFVVLTPEGEAALKASGLERGEFLRSQAQPDQLRVESLDTRFFKWARERGVADARIPQAALDWEAFQATKGFWRRQFATQNFTYVLDEVLISGNGVRNTFILVLLSVVGALTVNPMAAYALSRFKLRQSYHILLFFLVTLAFPAEVLMIPSFLQIRHFGLINTFGALVIPGLVNGFSIFLLKGFFDSLPRELYEAADIDGASEWRIFWGITMNLSRPILAVIALGAFTNAYGAFMFALILAPDPSMWTLMVSIYQLQQSAGPGIVYASIVITAIPTLLVYLCAQNVILRGIVVPTEK